MFENKRVLGVITARGGSKGVEKKNILEVGGKPLIAWTIESARKSRLIDRLILSSDDQEIIAVSERFGCEAPFIRPDYLASDTATSFSVVLHALDSIDENYDIALLLQPTSPLRSEVDIDECIKLSTISGSSVSVTECAKPIHWIYSLPSKYSMTPVIEQHEQILRRQDAPVTYALNGAVYAFDCQTLRDRGAFVTKETVPYVMPECRSLDIDSPDDINYFEFLLSRRRSSK